MTQRHYNPHAVIAAVSWALSPICGVFERLRRTYEFTTREFWLDWRITNYFLWLLNFSHVDPYKRVHPFLRTFRRVRSLARRHPAGPARPPQSLHPRPALYKVPP